MTPTNPNGSPARVALALCFGRGLPLCDSCTRCEDRYPLAAVNPEQLRLRNPGATDDGRCIDWKG